MARVAATRCSGCACWTHTKGLRTFGRPERQQRRHLRARLDALYFHLYGLDRDDADYVLSTFPIICCEDQAQFNRYRTKELILAYMNALTAGDTDARMAV